MSIQHKDIPDSDLHESKGVASAANRTAYVADGAGSGTWKKIGSENLIGLTGDGSVSDKLLLTDGLGGFKIATYKSYGVMGITSNTNNFAITASGDATLQSTTGYVLFSGAGAPWVGENLYGTTFSADKLTTTIAGVYEVRAWCNISTFPSNTALVGAKFRVNGSTWSPRTVTSKSNANGDHGEFHAFGLVTLAAGDYVQLYVASSATGNLVMSNVNLTLDLKRAL